MPNGSSPNPDPVSEPNETTEPAEPTEEQIEEVVAEARTPDEIEAIWRNRVAGKDRAHAAEVTTLRQELESVKERAARLERERQEEREGTLSEADTWKQRAEEAERRAEAAERQRIIDVRRAKYAAAAEVLDDTAFASMDEAKLAALHARLAGDEVPAPQPVDPNLAPKRSAAPPSGPREKSAEELENDLKKYESDFIGTFGG